MELLILSNKVWFMTHKFLQLTSLVHIIAHILDLIRREFPSQPLIIIISIARFYRLREAKNYPGKILLKYHPDRQVFIWILHQMLEMEVL